MEDYCITCGKWCSIAASWMCGECLTRWADNDSAEIMIMTAEDLPGRYRDTLDPPRIGTRRKAGRFAEALT